MPDKWPLIEKIAAELGHKPNARRMWLARGRVAASVALDILEIARQRRLRLTIADMRFPPVRKRNAA